MAKRDEERQPEEQVEDLDVPESESEDVTGGILIGLNKGPASLKHDNKVAGNIGGYKINPGFDSKGFK